MPALTIIGVDPATDQLHIAAHGLTTGDPFLAIYTPDGLIPGGLAGATYYCAIRDDADHVRLADSSAHAMARVAIDITDAGSGTLQLQRGLPYCVPRIAAPGVDIVSADDNAMWGSLVALWNLFTGQAQSIWDRVKIAVPTNVARANELEPFGINFDDCIIVTGGNVNRTAGIGGVVVDGGATAYFKLPPVPQYRRLNVLTVYIACGLLGAPGGAGPGPTLSLMTYDETGTTLVGVTGATNIEAGSVAVALTPSSAVANVAAVYVLKVAAVSAHDVTLKKGECLWDIP